MLKKFCLAKTFSFKKIFSIFSTLLFSAICLSAPAYAEDLLASGDAFVKETLGKDSSLVNWILILEILAGVFAYIRTKNLALLIGFVAVIIAINVGFGVIGA